MSIESEDSMGAEGADAEETIGQAIDEAVKQKDVEALKEKGVEVAGQATDKLAPAVLSVRESEWGQARQAEWDAMSESEKGKFFKGPPIVMQWIESIERTNIGLNIIQKKRKFKAAKWMVLVTTGAVGTREECAKYTNMMHKRGWTFNLAIQVLKLLAKGDERAAILDKVVKVAQLLEKGEEVALLALQDSVFKLEAQRSAEKMAGTNPVTQEEIDVRSRTAEDVGVPPNGEIEDVPKDSKDVN